MNPESKIRAVLFDAVGTLFRSRDSIGTIYAELASRHGVEASSEELDTRFAAILRREGTPQDPEGWRRLVAAVFGKETRFNAFDAFFRDVFEAFRSGHEWQLYAETKRVLDRLNRCGFRLGVITNFDNRVIGVLDDLGIVGFFDTVQTPESSGYRKPDPRMFRFAAGALGVHVRDTLMVGDDPVLDLAGAQRAGLPALLVDRRGRPGESGLVISDLSGVLGYVGESTPASTSCEKSRSDSTS